MEQLQVFIQQIYTLKKGRTSFEELKKKVDKVIVVTEISGLNSGLNITSGDFSLPAKGILIIKNRNTAIEQFVISGNIYELFKSILAVGNDIYFGIPSKSLFGSPSILFSNFIISGKG
uniref:metallopeptidase TldD-related protein n=1 Tax=Clostridium sp. NkU-1 TaxID=1095009 RepID=UPI0006D150C0